MNYRWLVVLLVVVALGAGAWMLLKPPELALSSAAPAADVPGDARKLPETTAPTATPTPAHAPTPAVAAPAAPARASNYAEFVTAKNLRALYDRLRTTQDGTTPEGEYLLYEILRRCANVSDRSGPRPMPRTLPTRDQFVASVTATDPQRDKRLAAFDQVEGNRCAGFENINVTQAELNKLLADATSAGDPKARALSVELELQQRRPGNRTLSDAQMDTLRQAIATRDPGAVMTAGRLISNTYQDLTVRVGPDGQVAEPRALFNAWQMLACEYGYPCGSDNSFVLTECALRSHCDATTLQDFLAFYGSSMNDSQLLAQYQQVLRNAVATGDWSQLAMVRGARPPGAPRMWSVPGLEVPGLQSLRPPTSLDLPMIKLSVNGKSHSIDVESEMPLLWVLRDELKLAGTKYGCGIAQCGACTVHVDGEAVRSCVTPVGTVAGKKVVTIEGLARPGLNKVQKAWIEHSVPQCGYCQTGMIMAATALLTKKPKPTDADIDGAMTNLCRCGTYGRVREAIHAAAGDKPATKKA